MSTILGPIKKPKTTNITVIQVIEVEPEAGTYVINLEFPDGYLLRLGLFNGGDKLDRNNYTIIDYLDPNQ